MARTRREHTVGRWTKLTTSVTPEIVEVLPMLRPLLPKLMEIEADVDRLITERDFYQARKQETTRKIQNALEEGRKVAQVMRVGLRQHFGSGNEGLVAFGIKPFRGRKRTSKAAPPADASTGTPDEKPDPSDGTPSGPGGSPRPSFVSLDTGKAAFSALRVSLSAANASLSSSNASLDRGKASFPRFFLSLKRGKASFPPCNEPVSPPDSASQRRGSANRPVGSASH